MLLLQYGLEPVNSTNITNIVYILLRWTYLCLNNKSVLKNKVIWKLLFCFFTMSHCDLLHNLMLTLIKDVFGKNTYLLWYYLSAGQLCSSLISIQPYFSSNSCFFRRSKASSISFCDGTATCDVTTCRTGSPFSSSSSILLSSGYNK